jgi:hypothetical protein
MSHRTATFARELLESYKKPISKAWEMTRVIRGEQELKAWLEEDDKYAVALDSKC